MTQLSVDYLGVAGNANTDFSREIMQSIAGQIEAELYCSEAYRQAVSNLKAMPEEAAKQMQGMLKSVSQVAIKLAMRQFVKQGKVVLPSETQPLPMQESAAATIPDAFQIKTGQKPDHWENSSTPIVADEALPQSPSQTTQNNKNSNLLRYARKSKKAELALLAAQEREECLRRIGKTIQQAREANFLTLRQLHSRTKVPVHQLEALEMGWLDRLPEDIYVRGFIRQIGNTLGLDTASLVNSLPIPDPNQAVLPSWYQPPSKARAGANISSLHLYVGYAALMAGGIAWLSQQSPPTGSIYPEIDIPADEVAPSSQVAEPVYSKKVNSKAGGVSTPEVSPPEVLRN